MILTNEQMVKIREGREKAAVERAAMSMAKKIWDLRDEITDHANLYGKPEYYKCLTLLAQASMELEKITK